MKVLVSTEFKHKDFNALWEIMLTKEPYKTDFKDILHLVEVMLVIPVTSAECEGTFSAQNHIKSDEVLFVQQHSG